MSVSERFALH